MWNLTQNFAKGKLQKIDGNCPTEKEKIPERKREQIPETTFAYS